MSEGFLRFKKRLIISAVIKSAVFGLSLGILTSSLFIVLQKIKYNLVEPLIPILFGVGALMLGGLCFFAILYPRNRRLAKRLDNELCLGERTQTMLQYAEHSSDMTAIQREDTNVRLLSLPKNALKEKRLVLHIIAPLLAIAMLLPAILIPLKAVSDPPTTDEGPEFIATNWQKTAVAELIAWVEESELEAEPKVTVLARLNELLVSLDTPMPEDLMLEYVVEIITDVDMSINTVNTFNEIAAAMLEVDNEKIKLLAAAIGSLSALTVKQELDAIKSGATKDELPALEAALAASLTTVAPINGDVLLPALITLGEEYKRIVAEMDSYSDQWVTTSISTANDTAFEVISPELFIQSENERVRSYVIIRLIEIFGIPEDMLPEHIKNSTRPDEDNEYDDKEDTNLNTGGYGNAEQIFGSNDTVYDPETNTHVSYGEILNAYYTRVKEQLIAGGTSDTLTEFIDAYFSSLYDGSKKE